jgi:hypothetical protein
LTNGEAKKNSKDERLKIFKILKKEILLFKFPHIKTTKISGAER